MFPYPLKILLQSEKKGIRDLIMDRLPASTVRLISPAKVSPSLFSQNDLFICDLEAFDNLKKNLCDALKSSHIPFILIIDNKEEKRVLEEICPQGFLWDYIEEQDIKKLPFILQRYHLMALQETGADEKEEPIDVLQKFRIKKLMEQNLDLIDDLLKKDETIHQLLSDEQKFKQMVEEAGEVVYTTDYMGNFTYVNPKVEEVTGYRPEELIGKFYLDLIVPEYRPQIEKFYMEQFKERRIETVKDFPIYNKKGEIRWVEQTVKLVMADNWVKGFYCVVRDITERKMFEKKLAEHAMLLEQSNKELEMFAYIASHDLKEPLRKISTFSTRIQALPEMKELSAKAKDYLSRLEAATKRMEGMIEDLLQYSRVGRKLGSTEPCDTKKILSEVMDDLDIQIKDAKAKISVKGLKPIKGIPDHIRRVFQNLISNSIKFRKKDVPLEIKIVATKVPGVAVPCVVKNTEVDYLKIVFSDNGIGFDNKYAKRVFEIFQRLHGKTEYPGTGIGLAIVKKVIERHKGCVEATSKEGSGTDFFIYFPLE